MMRSLFVAGCLLSLLAHLAGATPMPYDPESVNPRNFKNYYGCGVIHEEKCYLIDMANDKGESWLDCFKDFKKSGSRIDLTPAYRQMPEVEDTYKSLGFFFPRQVPIARVTGKRLTKLTRCCKRLVPASRHGDESNQGKGTLCQVPPDVAMKKRFRPEDPLPIVLVAAKSSAAGAVSASIAGYHKPV